MNSNINKSLKICVIDDDRMVVESLTMVLKELGFEPVGFSVPQEALKWIQNNIPDIAITDIRMPEIDGFAVLKFIKEHSPETNVIFITAHGQLNLAIRALREGATDFIEKPFTPETIQAAIERTKKYHFICKQHELLTQNLEALTQLISGPNELIIGASKQMQQVAQQIFEVADMSTTVLITGESGTGKELVAKAIHNQSSRRTKPILTINCASIPDELFEAEMFGHRRGAFTGAIESRPGYIQLADGGSLFLDEIGDMPLRAQAKILRFIEDKSYISVGERLPRTSDVRIIAATNQNLEQLVKEKKFREDLYYRLSIYKIEIPPLRERKEDIPLLALYFILKFASEINKPVSGIDEEAIKVLMEYDYPGNVRELRNIIESTVIHLKHPGNITSNDLYPRLPTHPKKEIKESWPEDILRFDEVERRLYIEALKRTNGNVSQAARLLGLSRGKLRRRIAHLGIKQPYSSGKQE